MDTLSTYRVRQDNFLIWNERPEADGSPRRLCVVSFERGDPKVLLTCVSVVIMRWSNEQSAFALEAYFSNGSVVSTQRAFRNRFNIAPLSPVPDRNM